MYMIDNLDYYKVFYYVAKEGSITKAAKTLSVSQPAVSQIIRQLEQQLEIPLFERVGKGIRLTTEGEALFSYVEKGYEQIRQGVRRLESMKNMEAGEIHIGASDMTLRFYLLNYLEVFHEQYPGIKVSVTNAPTPETLRRLQEGTIDFAVVSTPFEMQQGYKVWQVRKLQDIFVAGKNFEKYRGERMQLKQVSGLPLICLEKDTSTRKYLDAFMERNGICLAPEFELATSDMIVQFASRNLGVGCVVKDFAKELLEKEELFELTFNETIPEREMCLVINDKFLLSNAAKHMLDLLICVNCP